jgi:predicted PurR-regulated permease PerM
MVTPTGRWLALLTVTALALFVCWRIIEPFVDVILWGAVLAVIAYPYQLRLLRHGYRPALAAGITTCCAVLIVLVPSCLIGWTLVREAASVGPLIRNFIHDVVNPESEYYKFLSKYVDLDEFRDPSVLVARLEGLLGIVASRSTGVLGGIVGFVTQIFFVLFTLFYLLRDADRILAALRNFLPLSSDQAAVIMQRGRDVIYASVLGVVAVAAVQGFLGGLAFWILGLSAPVLWALVMFLLSMIPVAGAFLVWVPAVIWLAVHGAWIKATLLATWGVLVVGTVDNVLRPSIVGQRAKLHELVIFFSVLGGLRVFGVLGLFVGPTTIAITVLLIEVCREALADPAGMNVAERVPTETSPAVGAPGPESRRG